MKALEISEPIQMISWLELPKDIQRDFLYCEGEHQYDQYFFQYKGDWYYLEDFSALSKGFEWQGYMGMTYWWGLLVRYVDDGEYDKVVVGYSESK